MPKTHQRLTLSPEEELFLRQWMFDEVHFEEGPGPAKRLQFEHGAVSADLAAIIAAAIPVPSDQLAAALAPLPGEVPVWPWSVQSFQDRLGEAQAILALRQSLGQSP